MDNLLVVWQDRYTTSGFSDGYCVLSSNDSVTSFGRLFNDLVTRIFSSGRDTNVLVLQIEVFPLPVPKERP